MGRRVCSTSYERRAEELDKSMVIGYLFFSVPLINLMVTRQKSVIPPIVANYLRKDLTPSIH